MMRTIFVFWLHLYWWSLFDFLFTSNSEKKKVFNFPTDSIFNKFWKDLYNIFIIIPVYAKKTGMKKTF